MGTKQILDADMEATKSLTLAQRSISACCGAVITSLSMTPFDIVKIRLQGQQRPSNSLQTRRYTCNLTRPAKITPFDVIKTRLQNERRPLLNGDCFLYRNGLMDHICKCESTSTVHNNACPWYNRPLGQLNGTWDAFFKIARNEGPKSLWSGLSPTLVMAVPATVFYFSLYDHALVYLRNRFSSGHIISPMLAGSVARLAAVTLISPLEMIRTKLQSEKLSYKDAFKAIRLSKETDGWRVLWRGWAPTVLRDLPFSALYWAGYEWLKHLFMAELHLTETTFAVSCVSGAVSGSLAAMLTLPFDVIKTHRQVAIGQYLNDKAPKTSTWLLMKDLARKNGPKALFTGAVPRLAKVAPACAIMISSYEYGKLFFARRNGQRNSLNSNDT